MRLAAYNVENLFARPKAMDERQADAATRRAVLAAHARVSELLMLADYSPVAGEILEQLEVLGLLGDDEGRFALLRKLRGQLLRRPRQGPWSWSPTAGRTGSAGSSCGRPRWTSGPPGTSPK